MELVEIDSTRRMRREEAAATLRTLADALAEHNDVEFLLASGRISVHLPDELDLKVEVEIGDEGSELEIELTW